ncbi:MAG: cbb3-type cytochrome c oxidase subunit I [Gammaproteobacteria bacterium]|nr:cbb3-type cytochrome c oxidase subunit I [Gammaproteobacteria bacterium]
MQTPPDAHSDAGSAPVPTASGEYRRLIKFIGVSSFCLFVGTVHGVLQVIRPIRAWLDSIGSPYGGPGHLIDPLAHAHINVVGGVVVFLMGATYYLLPRMSGVSLYSQRLVEHTFWWTSLGIAGFYSTLMSFGIMEGRALLEDPSLVAGIHRFYGPTIATVSTIMGIGFWVYFANIFLTIRKIRRTS